MAARKDVSNLLFQPHFRKNHFREYLGQPLARGRARGPAGFLQEVPVGQDHAQVFVQQQNRRGNGVHQHPIQQLGSLAFGDIVGADQAGAFAREIHGRSGHLDVDHPSVFLYVLPRPFRRGGSRRSQGLIEQGRPFRRQMQLPRRHGQELFPRVTVILHGGVVHRQKRQRAQVVDPHRLPAVLKQSGGRFGSLLASWLVD